MRATEQWLDLLRLVICYGKMHDPRGIETRELVAQQSTVNMRYPLVTVPSRKLSYKFAAAEALWILTGSCRLDELKKYAPSYGRFSDDGRTLDGAYGPSFVTQVRYVVDKLKEDPDTRQAVMCFWNRCPRPSKDIPCTLTMQFLVRDGYINTIVNMRSSDVWLGWPYDVFSFTMMAAYVGILIPGLDLGVLHLMAGSQHLYQANTMWANEALGPQCCGTYSPMSIYGIDTPDDLITHLRSVLCGPSDHIKHPFFNYMKQLAHEAKEE